MEPLVIVGVSLAVIGVAFYAWNSWHEKKRTAAWQQVADSLGVEFRGDGSDILGRCAPMKTFSIGRSQRLLNVISADAGDICISLGDLRYVTGGGKHQHTHHETVCILEAAELGLPHCYLRPERRLFDSIGSLFGGQDIDFADDAAFSDAYVLQGENEAAIRELFDANVRSWFSQRSDGCLHFEACGNTFVFHTGSRSKPTEAASLMQHALEIKKLLPKTPFPETA